MKPSVMLHVVASMDPERGGVGKAVRLIIAGLEKHGIVSEILTLDPPVNDFCSNESFQVFAVGPQRTQWQYAKKLVPWLTSNFQNYDGVILHGLWLYNSYALRKVFDSMKRRARSTRSEWKRVPKLFVMPHGMLDPYFQKATGRRLKALRNWIYWKLIERKTVNHADGLLFTCEQEKYLARKSFRPYFPKLEIIVGLGVDEPPANANRMQLAFLQRLERPVKGPYILFLGRVNEKKGIDLLIEAYANFCSALSSDQTLEERRNPNHPEIPSLIIAGPESESSFGRNLKKRVLESAILKDRVLFTGMLSGDAKWGAFYGSEAFILPSHQENFGIAVVEAMACSKPVLISDQVNIWREIQESGAGLIESDTREGVLKMLHKWYALSEGERRSIQLNARKSFEKYFSGDLFAKKIAEIVYR